MTEEYVVLVDKDDNQIGLEEKVQCHLPNGKLHRAFTALIFDGNGNLLLARRSKEKMLWPRCWDGTVASHPREAETYVSSAERRMPEELGIQCKMDYLMKFEYHVPYKDIGSENEMCGTLIGVVESATDLNPIKMEIDKVRWISATELASEISDMPENYCPWMLIALVLLSKSESKILEKHQDVLLPWMDGEMKDALSRAIQTHLPDDKWRIAL